MIVRCSSCASAFAVSDEKVENKKFAFTCPKCATENIIDNRVKAEGILAGIESTPAVSSSSAMRTRVEKKTEDAFSPDEQFFKEIPEQWNEAKKDDSIRDETPAQDDAFGIDDAPVKSDDFLLDVIKDDISDEKMVEENFDLDMHDDLIIDEDVIETKRPSAQTADAKEEGLDKPVQSDDDSLTTKEEDDILEDINLDDMDSFDDKPAPKPQRRMDDNLFDEMTFDSQEKIAKEQIIEDDILNDDISFDDLESSPKSKIVVDELDPDSKKSGGLDDFDILKDDSQDSSSEKEIVDDFIPLEDDILEEEIYTKEKSGVATEDESITIDLESLDIDLSEEPTAAVSTDEIIFEDKHKSLSPNDENITLDLDSLDIDLEEDTLVKKGELPDDDLLSVELSVNKLKRQTEIPDEDITLNLDELDITLDETGEIMKGETPEDMDDEKLTLEDAGLTFDEISAAAAPDTESADEDEDIKLTIEDIDPSLTIENIHEEFETDDIRLNIDDIDPSLNLDNIDKQLGDMDDILAHAEVTDEPLLVDQGGDLPDIDIDEYFESDKKAEIGERFIDDDIVFDDSIIAPGLAPLSSASASRHSARRRKGVSLEDELYDIDEDRSAGIPGKQFPHFVPKGSLNFSIDYSLKYSRFMAAVKLFGLIFIGLIPHFIVLMLYGVLSSILGFLNQLIIITAGRSIEDFSNIQENTLRYLLSINALIIGVVDEMPVRAGRSHIDHPLQLNIIYPFRNSRMLASLRLSCLGILLFSLPHLFILTLISIAVPLVFLTILFSILITARCPHILFDFTGRYFRYAARVSAFMMGLVDEYPTFRFD